MSEELTDSQLTRISGMITQRIGLRFPPDRWSDLARGLKEAARELGLTDFSTWIDLLTSTEPTYTQLQVLANQLTVGETYFFRQPEVFAALRENILPRMLSQARAKDRVLRIWSAACSTGEEPYSLAILLSELLPDVAEWDAKILATDVNSHSLARAAKGIYSQWSFRETADAVRDRYFAKVAPNQFELQPRIREMVRFRQHNLVEQSFPNADGRGFDLIFCRNALMYFSGEWQEALTAQFSAALKPGGRMVFGPCDAPANARQYFEPDPDAASVLIPRRGIRQPNTTSPNLSLFSDQENISLSETAQPQSTPSGWSTTEKAQSISLTSADEPPLSVPNAENVSSLSEVESRDPGQGETAPRDVDTSAEARAAADRGELATALEACDRSLAANKLNPRLHFLRSCILQELGRTAEAEAALRRVLYIEPNFVMAHYALGLLLQERAPLLALRHLREATRILGSRIPGEVAEESDGLTVGRLHAVIDETLSRVS